MACNSMHPGSKHTRKFYLQQEAMNCTSSKPLSTGLFSDADIEALLAGAGYNVKASDLEIVAERLERLDSLVASQNGGNLSLSRLSSEAVHYNPSDMASWLDCLIEEIAPSSSSSARLAAQDVGVAPQTVEGSPFLPQAPSHYALQDGYGQPFSCSMGEELCMDERSCSPKDEIRAAFANCSPQPGAPSPMFLQRPAENAPSNSQLIKDAIGHSGVSSGSRGGPKCFSATAIHKEEPEDLQQFKIVEDQVSSNRMGRVYTCSAGDRPQLSPTSSSGFTSGFNPLPISSGMSSPQQQQQRRRQQHLTSIPQPPIQKSLPRHQMRQAYAAPASSQSSNGRTAFQDTSAAHIAHIPQQHRLLQNQVDVGTVDAKVWPNMSPSVSSDMPCQDHCSLAKKGSPYFNSQEAPDKLPHSQTLLTGTYVDCNDDGAAQESGIKLVHLLMACAEAIDNSELAAAVDMVGEIKRLTVSTNGAMSKVASHFVVALAHRISPGRVDRAYLSQTDDLSVLLFNNFFEACPYLKFAHFIANQAIFEAFQGHKFVHVIDFNLMQGLQWPALIQALAYRPGGPPHLRMTGIGLPHPDSKDVLQEVGMWLKQIAGSVNVEFSFRGMVATKLDDVKPWYFEVKQGEAIAVNSIFQLHRLLHPKASSNPSKAPIDEVLSSIKSLNPKVVTVVEQEANHNSDVFLKRFVEGLHYYSTMFDSLEACSLQPECPEMTWTEMYLAREITNIVACEGADRVERHEPLSLWQKRMLNSGFRPLHLGSNAFNQGSMLLKYSSGEGYTMEENKGCITLGWHSRPLIAASAWQCG